jgi:hypothetical protein
MDLAQLHVYVVLPALDMMQGIGGPVWSQPAARMLLAIARQEGGPKLEVYQQLGGGRYGPARGYWQFERGGGVQGVMYHPASTDIARALVRHYGLAWNDRAIHEALATVPGLAAGFARLLLWTDPAPLPSAEHDGWHYYLRNWRPGKPHPDAWPTNWRMATETVVPPR